MGISAGAGGGDAPPRLRSRDCRMCRAAATVAQMSPAQARIRMANSTRIAALRIAKRHAAEASNLDGRETSMPLWGVLQEVPRALL